ncbi:hypothetical protein PR003_g26723, partial [Phytophthora rubi]
MIAEFQLRRKQPSDETHKLWGRRTKDWVPTLIHSSRGKPTRVVLTNVSGKLVWCPTHFPVVHWAPYGELAPDDGYVRLTSARYRDWQVLAYEAAVDKDLLKREQRLYDEWLAKQSPAVERRRYTRPQGVMNRGPRRPGEDGADLTCAQRHEQRDRLAVAPMEPSGTGEQASESVDSAGVTVRTDQPAVPVSTDDPEGETNSAVTTGFGEATVVSGRSRVGEAEDSIAELTQLLDNARKLSAELETDENDGVRSCSAAMDKVLRDEIELSDVCLADDPEEDLRLRFVAAMTLCEDEAITMISATGEEAAEFESSANEIDLADYAHELAFLPDLTDSALTVLDYASKNVVCTAHTESQRAKLVEMSKKQEGIMIASGNALPPPAYGAICDIDVQGHTPIKQRARRVPLKHLKKLYELLKGLLKAGLIAFSKSPWASPILIVLKKNGVDIRLCIDYKMVNAITVLMEYAMPLVDDLLTELESYLWFCSLDAASGFWAVMMTRRAREISAFVCAL